MNINYYVAVTDNDWYRFLAELGPDEVNFWRPGGQQSFGVLKEGDPFLFKLHAPLDFIVGGGFFLKYTRLPLSVSWRMFGEKNGAADLSSLSEKIFGYRGEDPKIAGDPEIGCVILVAPFFFERSGWIDIPRDWSTHIVQGKTYDTTEPIGRELWEKVQLRLAEHDLRQKARGLAAQVVAEPLQRYGPQHLVKTRIGQGAFKVLVTDAYHRRCAISAEKTVPVLEAAHIRPFAKDGPNSLQNGILLRADFHLLFDEGYLTVTKEHVVEVSQRIKEEYENGKEYYSYHGQRLRVMPSSRLEQPSREFLDWHNREVFRP